MKRLSLALLVVPLVFSAPAYGHDPTPEEVKSEFTKMGHMKALQAVQHAFLLALTAKYGTAFGDGVIDLARYQHRETNRAIRDEQIRNARTPIEAARAVEIYKLLQAAGGKHFDALQANVDVGKELGR